MDTCVVGCVTKVPVSLKFRLQVEASVVVVVVVVLTLTRIIKSVVTGQAPVTLELRNTPGENTNNPRWYTHISQVRTTDTTTTAAASLSKLH